MTDDQLAELDCHLAAGTDVATALAAVDRPPASCKPRGHSLAWQIGWLIGLALYIALVVFWR